MVCNSLAQAAATFAVKFNVKPINAMEQNKIYYDEFHVAGRQYHDANEAWEHLKIGTLLTLERDESNRYDPDAIALTLTLDTVPQPRKLIIGYVPRGHNEPIAKWLDMGYGCAFECRISKIDASLHYEQQLRVTLSLVRNPNAVAK